MIPDDKIAEVRDRSDIAEVIGEYVTLRRAGANLKGVCPFHADSDPSFNVNPARQFFHCFGCGVSGDIFSFLQRIEGIDFWESLRRLAGRFGVELPEENISPEARAHRDSKREASKRRRFILEEATVFFEQQLSHQRGQPARELLQARGVDDETAKLFRLGYAPDSWNLMLDHMQAKRISPGELEEVGLARPRAGGGHYDAFRHRLMFTVTDPSGQPIAFSGRALSDDEKAGAKYINSPETPEYIKGNVLYGLHQSRVPMSKLSEAILVEGNFDVIAVAMSGNQNVVAPLGTALTEQQAQLLRRRVDRVTVMFDGDGAGRKAAARAFPILAKAGLIAYTAPMAQGDDPDSLMRREGPDALKKLLSGRKGLLDQIIIDAAAASDGSVQDSARRIQKMKPYLEALNTRMERDLYRQKLAEAFKMDIGAVFKGLQGVRANNEGMSKTDTPSKKIGGREGAERDLLGLLLDQMELYEDALTDGTIAMVTSDNLRKLLEKLGCRNENEMVKESSVANIIASPEGQSAGSWLAQRALKKLYTDKEMAIQALSEIRAKLVRENIGEQIRGVEDEIRQAVTQGDEIRQLELFRKKAQLQKTQLQTDKFDGDSATV